ncbi:hypothetical protein [Neorickettsia sennetsu]|uniref:Uncharacterized protein n=1 Tax=Ehrlichia sennetsu (strain ATCC VR-367 / Miyayama) TaxID=222891 RepID=Q2GEE2_EHRS3|nr:hypothetical protein [Neorickettsia sennetsu]ABD46244.1 hypothetical protein NSE_0261 [Neorickettsia sennetsu str. Miyayama]
MRGARLDAVLSGGASLCRKGQDMFFNMQADRPFVEFKGELNFD